MRVLTFLILFFCLSGVLLAEEYCKIEEMNLLPVRYYIGDNVELRLLVSVPPGRILEQPVQIPEFKWIEINENVRISHISDSKYEIRILFTAFMPGSHILSNIIIGDFIIPDVKIDTRSILEDKAVNRLAAYENQIILPGTWLLISVIVFVVVFIPYIFLLAGKQILRIIRKINLNRKKELPGNKLKKGLRKLKRNLKKINPLAFYTKITELLREYLHARLNLPVLTATTRELTKMLQENLQEEKYGDRIIKLFNRADLIKFAGSKGSKGELSSVLNTIFGLVDSIEEEDNGI
jgi:hypothetical protein